MVRDQIDESYETALRTLSPLRYCASFIILCSALSCSGLPGLL